MKPSHYSGHSKLDEALVGFSRYCRNNGLSIGLSHTHETLRVANIGLANDRETLRFSLKALYSQTEEEGELFDKCFEVFFGKRKHQYAHTIDRKGSSNIVKKTNASLVMMGFNPNPDKDDSAHEDARNVTGMSRLESLKRTDFSRIAAIDSPELEELTERLLQQLNHRLKRKLESTKDGKIDLRKSIRKNLSRGDLMMELSRRNRKKQRYRLILLLDVSGSMDKYSFFLLKFIWSLKSHLKNIEAFVFSTKLVRITDMLAHEQLTESLWQMSQYTDNWSSGTKIGECLKDFNENYSKRILNGKSVTIILSDGLDGGEPDALAGEVRKIRLRTSKLVWLNPLKGMKGYQPIAKGMKAAHTEVDEFASAHNLESLLELENLLSNV